MPLEAEPGGTKAERRDGKKRAARKMRVHNAARWQQVRELQQKRAKEGPGA